MEQNHRPMKQWYFLEAISIILTAFLVYVQYMLKYGGWTPSMSMTMITTALVVGIGSVFSFARKRDGLGFLNKELWSDRPYFILYLINGVLLAIWLILLMIRRSPS